MTEGITSQTITRQFVVVAENPPASPFEGQLWRDKSSDTLKQWDGSQWVSVQISPDNKSITITNGELALSVPKVDVAGDFESDVGTWDYYIDQFAHDGDYELNTSSTRAKNGSNSLRYKFNGSDTNHTASIESANQFDLTDIQKIKFWYYPTQINGSIVYWKISSDRNINNNTEKGIDLNLSTNQWHEVVIDVSSLSGSYYMGVWWSNGSGPDGTHEGFFDDIRFVKSFDGFFDASIFNEFDKNVLPEAGN